jgi:hypothetical protein
MTLQRCWRTAAFRAANIGSPAPGRLSRDANGEQILALSDCGSRLLRFVCASPCRRGISHHTPKTVSEMRLICKPTTQRYITEGYLCVEHPSRRQFDPSLEYKGGRRLIERAPEQSREMCAAIMRNSTQIGYQHSICNMRIYVCKDIARLPGE